MQNIISDFTDSKWIIISEGDRINKVIGNTKVAKNITLNKDYIDIKFNGVLYKLPYEFMTEEQIEFLNKEANKASLPVARKGR